ncbi:uncharacterized protein EI97DRAFT_312036 [Westerdykella ornata]|uniref:C2H2-type domain-containing protein n=1 Tax=Westerdykella ornata TaxID=318751 RepID=A0A6A6JQD8_WESOR|nr:uncharacterized protein EI97DRAFT_312036 [Westerdykella ornata]KAF2277179.1 hypothetical protein EI97DRAFT_312036 [Westerdykella ornata]
MAEKRTAAGGDTDFRRTFNREEAAARGAERERREREEAKARYEAKLQGKKYYRRESSPPDARPTEARTRRLDMASMVGKTMVVPAGAAVGRRGRGAGFYCEACDLTFKDNKAFIEHEISPQHLRAIGETGEVRVATLEEVRERLQMLAERKREAAKAKDVVIDVDARLEMTREREEQERQEKREKRNQKRRKQMDPLEAAEAMLKRNSGD